MAIHHYEDPQCQMSDAEVMTTAIVAALFFAGNYESARSLLAEPHYFPAMLSKSRFKLTESTSTTFSKMSSTRLAFCSNRCARKI